LAQARAHQTRPGHVITLFSAAALAIKTRRASKIAFFGVQPRRIENTTGSHTFFLWQSPLELANTTAGDTLLSALRRARQTLRVLSTHSSARRPRAGKHNRQLQLLSSAIWSGTSNTTGFKQCLLRSRRGQKQHDRPGQYISGKLTPVSTIRRKRHHLHRKRRRLNNTTGLNNSFLGFNAWHSQHGGTRQYVCRLSDGTE